MAESMDAVAENMLKVRAVQEAGGSLSDLWEPELEVSESALPVPTASEVSYVISGSDAMIATRPTEMVPTEPPPPGLTERGWSSEVTARHPLLVAATMAELNGGGSSGAAKPIDPQDTGALQAALNIAGGAEYRKDVLRARAIRLNEERLSEAMQKVVDADPAYWVVLDEEEAEPATAGTTSAPKATRASRSSSTDSGTTASSSS